MARAVRNMRGNKRMGSHNKTIVPQTSYYKPPDIPKIPFEEPIEDVGKPIKITKVIIHEISLTYEGNPKNPTINIHEMPFSDLVGDPITQEQIDKGVIIKTVQGETLLVRWHERGLWFQSGISIHLLAADHTQLYQPNWGNICGVGIEWETEDGTMSGFNWSKNISARSESTDENDPTIMEYKYNKYYVKEKYPCGTDRFGGTLYCERPKLVNLGDYYAPESIRPHGMCGNPKNRTLGRLGMKLPIRVYPAIGKPGQGLVFCFKSTIMQFIDVEPEPINPPDQGGGTEPKPTPTPTPTPEFIIKTDKVLLTTEPIGEFISHKPNPYVEETRSVADDIQIGYQEFGVGDYPNLDVALESKVHADTESIYIPPGLTATFYPEQNFQGTPWAILEHGLYLDFNIRIDNASDEYEWLNYDLGSYYQDFFPPSIRTVFYHSTNEEPGYWWYPSREKDAEHGFTYYLRRGSVKITGEPTTQPIEQPTDENNISYFCDSSIDSSSIDTFYWDVNGIKPEFYKGLNQFMDIFEKPMLKVNTSEDYYKYLWKLKHDSLSKVVNKSQLNSSWQEFYEWAKSEFGCLSKYQIAGLYMTHHLKLPVLFYDNIALDRYFEGNRIDYMIEYILKTKPFAYDFLTFQDVIGNPNVGAYNVDITPYNPTMTGFKSHINVEPSGLDFKCEPELVHLGDVLPANLTDALKPWDYITTGLETNMIDSPMWDFSEPISNPYNPKYWGGASEYDDNRDGLIAAQVIVHEMGHAIDTYAFDTCGTRLSHTEEFMKISGFTNTDYGTTTHEVMKSKGIHDTGGKPMTDSGKEAPVSTYGCTCAREAFAEAYRMYVFNPKFLADQHPQQYYFMETYVKSMTENKTICPIE